MKNRVEGILNRYGWKTVNGHAEYKGFEFKLNPEIADWRIGYVPEPEVPIRKQKVEDSPAIPIEVSPEVVAAMVVKQATHNDFLAAQKRVVALREKAKAIKK